MHNGSPICTLYELFGLRFHEASTPWFRKPFSRPYRSLLRLIQAHSRQRFRDTRTLGWSRLKCGGMEHKMSTPDLTDELEMVYHISGTLGEVRERS